ncbi:MAG: type III-B CRISPR module RAMP protein Cmr4 [Planctomycetaceae bacterium]|nr:MAG: type III-B CRISPR module RAMP protein Cmr4 [Planctomycetaceae bacterium]
MTNVCNRKAVGALLHLHALTGVHWGSGSSLGTVDLPIQRERHTEWPNGAGSALKGVLRDTCREAIAAKSHAGDRTKADSDSSIRRLFGSIKGAADTNAGALCVTDARLLAFPVRSLKGVFAWITCPAVLTRLRRDAELAGIEYGPFDFDPATAAPAIVAAAVANNQPSPAWIADGCPLVVADEFLQLDDETLTIAGDRITELANWISEHCLPAGDDYQATRQRLAKHLVVVPDDVFTHFSKYATEVVARIGLDYKTKTVKTGALFYQELLPAESLMYSVLIVNESRSEDPESGSNLLSELTSMIGSSSVLQVGGDETTGKGYCSVHFSQGSQS